MKIRAIKISRWGFVQLKLKPCKDVCMVFSAKQGNTLTVDNPRKLIFLNM
jgi:hypothetical protein